MQSKAQIDQILRQKCEAKEIPGVVAMAATGNEVIYQGAFGKRDLGKDDPMTADSVFWIASMTKAITSAAGMQLVEQGKLSLDEPIGKLLPDLANPQVLEGFDASGEPKLRPAKKPITLRHLMTHTAGFCYDMWNGDMGKYLEKTGTPNIISCQNAALKAPIMSDPGTRWEYGINIDFVGKAVEAASGKKLDAYLRDNMFAPLGMNDTGFKITDSQRQRLVGMHARGEDGSLAPIPFELEQDAGIPHGWRRPLRHRGRLHQVHPDDPQQGPRQRQPAAEAGDGRADGPEPHRRSHHGQDDRRCADRTPTMSISIPISSRSGGLSFLINTAKTPEGRSAGSLAWAGLANTYFWIDPARNVSGVILMQLLPFADGKALETFAGFERGVYAGLDAGSGQRAA